MDESWASLRIQASVKNPCQEPHREPHLEPHDVSPSFLRPGVLPDDGSFGFGSTTQHFAVDFSPPNAHFLNAETGIRPFFDGPTSSTSWISGEAYDLYPPSDQFIDGRSPYGDGGPQQQFSTVIPRSTGGSGAYLPGAHTGTASNVVSMAEEVDFEYGDPTHRTANSELSWGIDSNPPMPWMGFQNVEATLAFDQTSGVEVVASTEQSNTEYVPTQSSGSNDGRGMTQYQYQTSPIPITETTAPPEHDCFMPGCTFTSMAESEIGLHLRSAHLEFRACRHCQQRFPNVTDLGWHALKTGHASFACPIEDCEKLFSRRDVLERHLRTHRPNMQRFPCPHCRRHRGADGFKRKDHLTQHLRNYHHIGVDNFNQYLARERSCPHDDCPEWRRKDSWGNVAERDHAFNKSSDYIAHMRKVHKESELPCTEPGCNRVGPKGYFRMRDLQKHKLKAHGIPIE